MSNEIVDIDGVNVNEVVVRRRGIFDAFQGLKNEISLKSIANDLMMVPGFVKSLESHTEYIADIPKYIQKGLDNGTLKIMQKKTGEYLAIVINSDNHQVVKKFTLKATTVTPNLGPALLVLGLQVQMKQIQKGIDELNKGIQDVLKNFENDRYARAISSREKFYQAQMFSDQDLKKKFIIEILSDVTNTKHMLYYQIKDKVDKLLKSKSLFKSKEKIELANDVLNDLFLFNETFKIQVQCYAELKEYYPLSHALDMYTTEMNTVLKKEVQYAVDGYFDDPTNPFSNAIVDVISSVNATSGFLIENEEMIKLRIEPMKNEKRMEMLDYGDM